MNNKSCRYCHYFDTYTGCCSHEDMFIAKDEETKDNVKDLEILYSDGDGFWNINDLLFKVINPEIFSCCYFG